MRQTHPKKESAKVEKLKTPPPPAKIYLIPIPERDKKSQVQLFNTQTAFNYQNTTRPLPSSTENFVTSSPLATSQMNYTFQEPKQFLIRILNEEGKSFMLRITGDDVQVKKKGNGYMIGVSHNEAKANINIELPDKSTTASKKELIQSTTNQVDKTPPPLFTGYPSGPEKYQVLDKGGTTPGKLSSSPIPPFPAYPYPIFLAPQFFQPQALPYENQFHPQQVTQYPTTIEKPQDSQKQYFTPTKQPETEEKRMNTTKEVTKPARFQVTVRVKGEPVMKQTVAEMRTTTTEQPTTQSAGYHYPAVDPRYQFPPLEPRYQYQQPYPESNPPRYQQQYSEPQEPRYQWYLQPPAPSQQGAQQADQHRDYQQNNWNFAHFTPYPSYLQDTLSPPYLPTGYGRSAGQAK
ncbi:hypothetical protein A483_HHAL012319 [Halyomorpha halys]|nr:hypothetical protein A483_HHAL012319 [Halyomorpha halys]